MSEQHTVRAGGPDSPIPNVTWQIKDSVSACPAGDSVIAGHPSRLRILVWYMDANDEPRVGVPPESIYIGYSTGSGNAKINDKAVTVTADDPTDANGQARITIPSLSGSGNLSIGLYVSGVSIGSKTAHIRTTDADASGRDSTGEDPPDINWSGSVTKADSDTVANHLNHWRRHALHGTLAKRTNFRDDKPYGNFNTDGEGEICWSPSGRNIAYSVMDSCYLADCPNGAHVTCRVAFVRATGGTPRQITYNNNGHDSTDYDPTWSPRGQSIFYDRQDYAVHRKGVPGYNSDTSDVYVFDGVGHVLTHLSISPNGDNLAYVREVSNRLQVFIAPVAGGSSQQVTSDNATYGYPQWSPDGNRLIVDRRADGALTTYQAYVLDLRTGGSTQFFAPSSSEARNPAFSPDSVVAVAAVGAEYSFQTKTLEATGSTASFGIANYGEYLGDLYVFPHLSPDGTRLAVLAEDPYIAEAQSSQLFAARLNMNTPPKFTQIGSQGVADSTVNVSINSAQGLQSTVTVTATDAESDALTYSAQFLKDGMTFSPSTRTLTWTPSAAVGTVFNVVFYVTTASGGSDAMVASLTVTGTNVVQRPSVEMLARKAGPNLVEFELTAAKDRPAALDVFDVTGRRVRRVVSEGLGRIGWDGVDQDGRKAASGIYLYRLATGTEVHTGRVAVIR